jgi:hypothetical protein
MTPLERIRAALLQAKPPVANHPTPQPVEFTETPPSVTVSEENLAALLRSVTASSWLPREYKKNAV